MTRSLFLILCLSFLFFGKINAQNPLKFSSEIKDLGNGQADLICIFDIQDGWKTYSQFLESQDGPVATSLTFKEGAHFKLLEKAVESGEKKTMFDPVFGMNLTVFKHKATFTQRVQILDATKPIVGFIEAMSCDDAQCLPPKQFDFSLKLPVLSPKN